jgi:LAO/AO transport system kinase
LGLIITNNLQQEIVKGNRFATARAITFIEDERDGYIDLLSSLYKYTGKAFRIGVTGPPGAGKSTFTNQLAKIYRKQNKKVGIIAVDPTSPYTGGAILGDRVRMVELTSDKGVFIRSMATRGSLGGLARQATEVADVLDAAGYEIIIYETVGVGQIELDIAEAADTTIVMIVPEGGDIIQGMKAGLMEIGDIFVLNKSDRPGADRMQRDMEYVLHLRKPINEWYPKVMQTQSHKNIGVEEVKEEISKHEQFLINNDLKEKYRNKRLTKRIKQLVENKMNKYFWTDDRKKVLNEYLLNDKKSLSPYALSENLLKELKINNKN